MSLHLRGGLSTADERRRLAGGRNGYLPTDCGKVIAWFRNSASAGAISSWADMLSASPLTQATAANQPTGTTLNGNPAVLFDGSNDFMLLPITAANTTSPRWGVALSFKLSTTTGDSTILGGEVTISGASLSRIYFTTSGTTLFVDIYTGNFVSRRASIASVMTTSRQVVTLEYDGGQATEGARCVLTNNGTILSPTFSDSNGTPPGSTMPATLRTPTGTMAIGEQRVTSTLRPFQGTMARDIVMLAGAGGVSGGGLLTVAERADLVEYLSAA